MNNTNIQKTTISQSLAKDWFIILLLLIGPLWRSIRYLPEMPTELYYGILGFAAVYILIKERPYSYGTYTAFLILFCTLSILLNTINPRYHAEERLLGLIFIIASVGTLFFSHYANQSRFLTLSSFFYLAIAICITSSLIFIIDPGLCITERGSLYGGILKHSMLLSPIAGLATLLAFSKNFEKGISKGRKTLWVILTIICFLNCLQAGSRSALGATILALLLWLWVYYENNKIKFFKKYIDK